MRLAPMSLSTPNSLGSNFGTAMSYSNTKEKEETHRYDVSVSAWENGIAADAKYCLAA